ncbi:pirin domain-containing protein [Meredithblackwellia eburnea MCA 4105]
MSAPATAAPAGGKANLIHRPSDSRGHAEHGGWLKSYHTFNFGEYYSEVPREQGWGTLKVINEDRVGPSQGFPPHRHSDFEIFSYVVDGKIEHRDSMKNIETLKRGDLQMTSAGKGIVHSEYNGGTGSEDLHFLQCWARPTERGLKPNYYTRHFTDEEKTDVLLPLVAPIGPTHPDVTDAREAEGPTPIHSPLTLYASILTPGKSLCHLFQPSPGAKCSKGYLHLIMRSTGYRIPGQKIKEGPSPKLEVELIGKEGENQIVTLVEGDGVYFDEIGGSEVTIKSVGEVNAEFVLFDLE